MTTSAHTPGRRGRASKKAKRPQPQAQKRSHRRPPASTARQIEQETITLGQLIRAARRQRGWSMVEASRHIGISPGYLYQLETGRQPSIRSASH
ncbi:MAG: helix-turn-helix domain-containing protein [Planctomycetota bacterium]|jgi:ribosome-binding protein aMBF1 (putative translation factor)